MNENQVSQQNPFAGQKNSLNAGTVTIESSRAVAETQGKILLAKRFPRNEAEAYEKVMIACSRRTFAEKALYSYPRGKDTIVSGASIRLAEELARCWGNLDYGIKELSQKDGESEMLAYCWDMENNLISSQTFVVEHARDTTSGRKELKTQRDIYENNANMAGRRLRARILAVLPPDLIDAAIMACRQTLDNQEKATPQQIEETKQAFAEIGVNLAALEQRIGHTLDDLTMRELNDFYGIHNSITNGHSSIYDWFDVKTNNGRAKSLTDKIMGGNHQDGEQLVMTATE